MSKPNPQPAKAESATQRRSKNALLVAIAVLAAAGITIIANYVVYWQYRGMSPGARQWVRYDLTSTRRYSLSEQSRGVLDSLDGTHRLVTMLGGDTIRPDQQQRIRDLVDEYGRASKQIEVQHIDLDTETDRRAALLAEMDAMFAEDTAAIRASIAQGLKKVERFSETVDTVESRLKTIIDSGIEMRPASIQSQRLTDLHSQYLRLQDHAQRIAELRDRMLGKDWYKRLEAPGSVTTDGPDTGDSLPNYTELMAEIQRYVIQLTRNTLLDTPGKADQIRRGIVVDRLANPEVQQAALSAQNTLAALTQQVPELTRTVMAETDPLLAVTAPLRYEDARAVLSDKPCVLLTSGGDARVLPADLLFRGAGSSAEGDTNDLFVGEEQLTGALVSMRLDPPPLVVFIRSNTGLRALSATGSEQQRLEGVYDHVTKRLLAMDFEVAEWADPVGTDPPIVRPDQRVVWITLPYLKPDTRRKESLDNTRKEKVASFLGERLSAGDSALVMLSFNPDTDPELTTGGIKADALANLLDEFGIEAQLYQNVSRLSEEDEDPEQSKYSADFLVSSWPGSAIVGESLDGIDTYFFTPMPLQLNKTAGIEQTPLVELDFPAMHVQRTVPERETGKFTPEPGSERDRVLIGAAAERGESRVVTIGDATWALDNFTSLAVLPDGKTGTNLADQPGARLAYPGNTDLFVNCVCWLAHEDGLIAASPRVQDVRRIGPMSANTLSTYRVLLWGGMPGIIFAAGIGVWLMRRRA